MTGLKLRPYEERERELIVRITGCDMQMQEKIRVFLFNPEINVIVEVLLTGITLLHFSITQLMD